MASRKARSRSVQQRTTSGTNVTPAVDTIIQVLRASAAASQLPEELNEIKATLDSDDFQLLLLKQRKLRDSDGQLANFIRECDSANTIGRPSRRIANQALAQAARSTVVFAQEEAGTAFCVSPTGLLLTCSHCVADSYDEFRESRDKWLLFSSGQVVRAKCTAWDPKRDLAILQIIAAQSPNTTFPHICIATSKPKTNTSLLCIGHPGSEDLEASTAGLATEFDILHISIGRFRGLVVDQDQEDNSEIGALMHDCWTYWGHSGAPLIERSSGKLAGVHSSWDDETGMRRGVPLQAVRSFLAEHAGWGLG